MNDTQQEWFQQAAVLTALIFSTLGIFLGGLSHAYDIWKKWHGDKNES